MTLPYYYKVYLIIIKLKKRVIDQIYIFFSSTKEISVFHFYDSQIKNEFDK